ncbi:MAG: polyprenyl synthetase family protein [Planctomycetota bacterium]|jgi:geranylgeranyl pyrophosphate synthase
MPAPENDIQQSECDQATGDLKAFFAPIAPEIEQVKQRITELLQTPDPQIAQCLELISKQTGKMLRPALVLLSGQIFAPLNQAHIDMAAMVELTHMASLLHDDVIDSGHIRRGQSSANALWGNTAAVLLGDYLLSQAFYLGSSLQLNGATAILCQTARTLCTGELKQNLCKGISDMTEADYYQIIEAKTAALFQCSCQLGVRASGGSDQHQQAFCEFGRQLGLAFQITDDLLDILSTQHQTGKTLGTDLLQEKFTLPIIHWISQDPQENARKITLLSDIGDVEQLIDLIQQGGSITYAIEKAKQHVDAALQQLDGVDSTPASEALRSLTHFVINRVH